MFATILLGGFLAAAPADPEVKASDRALRLVAQLGDPSYRAREQAAKDLVGLGGAALEALRQGLGHADPEVAERCRKLIPQALDLRLQEEIEQFLSKPDGPIPKNLPGIGRWVKIAGSGKVSRELYAQMVRDHRKLLIELEQEPSKAPARFRAFVQEAYTRNRAATAVVRKDVTYTEVALFLFLGSDPAVKKETGTPANPSLSYLHSNIFLSSTHVPGMLSGVTSSDATRALFLAWLEQERNVTLIRRGFLLAGQAELKQAAPIALSAAKDKGATPQARSYALIAGAKLFGKEHLKELGELMADETPVAKTVINGATASTEIRDIALGIAVQATGQKVADYGFERYRDPTPATGVTSYTYYSLTEKQREDAFKKWKDWQAQQPK